MTSATTAGSAPMMNIHCQPKRGTTEAPTTPDIKSPTGKMI